MYVTQAFIDTADFLVNDAYTQLTNSYMLSVFPYENQDRQKAGPGFRLPYNFLDSKQSQGIF